MIRRPNRHTRNRASTDPSNRPTGGNVGGTFSVVATKLRVAVNGPVSLNGIPQITVQGVLPTAVTIVNPTTFDLTYAAAVVVTNAYAVPSNDPAIRTSTGGYLSATAGLV